MKVVIIGPPGSGKSTQGKLLADFLNIPYISTGDIFRKIASENSDRGQKIRQILNEGKLVDDKTTSEIVEERLKEADLMAGFIFDGYPRTFEQIKYFDPGFDKVFYLKLSDEEATKRLLERGRTDDKLELIAERLKIYHQLTAPILDYYRQKNLLESIDGSSSIDQIQQKIRQALND